MLDDLWFGISLLPWWMYLIPVIGAVSLIVCAALVGEESKKHLPEADDKDQRETERTYQNHPVIGYKTAGIESISLDSENMVADIKFVGLMGTPYSVDDETRKTGSEKFNMYHDVKRALHHEQDWGSALLEAVGYGSVESHSLGYTSQHQRVLQVAFLGCSTMYTRNIRCKNSAEYLARKGSGHLLRKMRTIRSGYRPHCSGCVQEMDDVLPLEHFYNRSFDVNGGNTVVIAGRSSREHIDFIPTVPDKNSKTEGSF